MNVINSLLIDNMASMSSMAQLLEDNDRVAHKLNKVRLRRDHYARLYFQTLSELDQTKWKLGRATETIRELNKQGGSLVRHAPYRHMLMLHV